MKKTGIQAAGYNMRQNVHHVKCKKYYAVKVQVKGQFLDGENGRIHKSVVDEVVRSRSPLLRDEVMLENVPK